MTEATTIASTSRANSMVAKIRDSIFRLVRWVESNDYRAYDPGDGNNSFLNVLTFNNLLLERLLQQSVYRAPINLRPLLGIKPHTSTKGMGYMAWGYTKMYGCTGESAYRDKAIYCLNWLMQNRSNYAEFCWGNDFSFSSRGGKIPKGEPTIVWSSLIGESFYEAAEVYEEDQLLDVAISTGRWILSLPREKTSAGECLSYVAFSQTSIHNSNMLGAALLARVGAKVGNGQMLETAREAMLYSCTRQRPDGSWYYGEEPKFQWIDNFHTGYNLESLRWYQDATGNTEFNEHLTRGFEFLRNNFFEADGCPKYYHNKKYPVDIQCAAQAIDTLTLFSDLHPESLDLAIKVAGWTIEHMQAADGHFYYRDMGWAVNKTPMLHWGQGTMFKALAHLLTRLTTAEQPTITKQRNAGFTAVTPELAYVLITAARNEKGFIENTIRSVIAQTKLPQKWIIVSDGSTDGTDEIVKRYAATHQWIELVRMPEHRERHFAAKAVCFNAALNKLAAEEYDIIGNLDADITFEPDYIDFLLRQFARDPKLGVAGTPYVEVGTRPDSHTYSHRFAQLEHVSGACQLFRKQCFHEIGGYVPVKNGAVDWIAVTTARMNGWRTRTFLEKRCLHHRPLGTGTDRRLMVYLRYGQKAHAVGGHPAWETLRGFFQMRHSPYVMGGLWFLLGFWSTVLRQRKRAVSQQLMAFHRAEQLARLRTVCRRACSRFSEDGAGSSSPRPLSS